MKYKTQSTPEGVVISISERLIFSDHEKFRNVINMVANNQGQQFILDLSELEFIDSAGLGMLLIVRDEAARTGRPIGMRGLQGQVEKVLRIAQFDELFEFV